MGRFTGKSDFEDWCEMHHKPEEVVEKAKVYHSDCLLDTSSTIKLIPYYTHLMSMLFSSKEEGQVIHLSRDSFIDSEEREVLALYLELLLPSLRKLKKLKKDYTQENLKEFTSFSSYDWHTEWLLPVLKIITENPEIIKYHYPKERKDARLFIESFIIPKYFIRIHSALHNRERVDFVNFAKEKGFTVFKGKEVIKGEYSSPVILHFCYGIQEYEEMVK